MVELTLESALSLSVITAIVTWRATTSALKKERTKYIKLSIESKITEMDLTKRIQNLMVEIANMQSSHIEEIESLYKEIFRVKKLLEKVENNDL